MNSKKFALSVFTWWFCVITCVLPGQALSQTVTSGYSGLAAINRIVQGAAGGSAFTFGNAAGSGIATGTAIENALVNGLRVPMSTAASTTITAARIGSVIGGLSKAATGIGLATMIVPWAFGALGWKICAAPMFICKPGNTYAPLELYAVSGTTCYFNTKAGCSNTPLEACRTLGSTLTTGPERLDAQGNRTGNYPCGSSANPNYTSVNTTFYCSPGDFLDQSIGGGPKAICKRGQAAADVEVSAQEVSAYAQQQASADSTRQKSLYDYARSNAPITDIHQTGDTVTVTATPNVLPPTVSSEKVRNADGSTSTKTTTTTATVKAVQQGTTLGNAALSYTSNSVIVIDEVNDTTGVKTTTTNSNTQNGSTDAPILQLPTDYNREVTQQAIQAELSAANAPSIADQKVLVTAATDKSDADLAKMRSDAAAAQTGASPFFAWVWTPPVGSCTPNTGSVHGYTVAWDICPTVNNIREVLGWIMGIFSLASVYTQLFRKGDE